MSQTDDQRISMIRDDLATNLFKECTWHTDSAAEAVTIATKCRMQADALIDELVLNRWTEGGIAVRRAQQQMADEAAQDYGPDEDGK